MKYLMHASVITVLVGFSGLVQAAPALTEIASDKTDITVAGQSYDSTTSATFFQSGLPLSAIRNVFVTFDVQGDYDYVSSASDFESLNFSIEGFAVDLNRNTISVAEANRLNLGNYYHLSGSFEIEQSLWNSIAADNILNISWQNTNAVGNIEDVDPQFSASGDYVKYTVSGQVSAVPEPSTYALMLAGLGLVGFMANRRRKV